VRGWSSRFGVALLQPSGESGRDTERRSGRLVRRLRGRRPGCNELQRSGGKRCPPPNFSGDFAFGRRMLRSAVERAVKRTAPIMQVTPVTCAVHPCPPFRRPFLAHAFVAPPKPSGAFPGGEPEYCARRPETPCIGANACRGSTGSLLQHAAELRGGRRGPRATAAETLTDFPVRGLLLTALAELAARPQSAHAVVHQAVEAAALLGTRARKGWSTR